MFFEYSICDTGVDVQMALIRDGQQVGNLIFDYSQAGQEFEYVRLMGEYWKKFTATLEGHTIH